jgi:hypothetical protein
MAGPCEQLVLAAQVRVQPHPQGVGVRAMARREIAQRGRHREVTLRAGGHAAGGRFRKQLGPQRARVVTGLGGELARVQRQLHQPVAHLLELRAHRDGVERRLHVLTRVPHGPAQRGERALGQREQLGARQLALLPGRQERHQRERGALPTGAHHVSGKHCARASARW